jgi:hypothetical protein
VRGLGRLYDIGLGVAPVDLDTANGATGKRISMLGASAIDVICIIGAAASGTDDVVIDVQQHTAYTGGTSKDLDSDPSTGVTTSRGISEWYIKSETLLDNDEAWTRVTQTAASEITLTGATYAATQKIVAFSVEATQLGTGYTHMSVNVAVTTSAVQLATVIYLPVGLRAGARPDRLMYPNLLRPGAANV